MARTSRTNARRRRHRILGLVAAGAMAVVVALVVAIIVIVVRRPESPPTAVPPTALPPTSSPGQHKPRPEFQDASCPDVQMIAIPGTWESSPTDDPLNPTQFPLSLIGNVTRPLAGQFGRDRVEVYTVPYTAQFHNPLSSDKQMSYNDSRAEGTRATVQGDDRYEQPLPADQLCAGRFLAGRGDRRRYRQRYRQRAWPGRRGPGPRCDVDRRRPPPGGRRAGHRPQPARARAPRSRCTSCPRCPRWA